MERKFLDFSLPGSECCTERKFHGSESSLYGLFAPENESAEERQGQLPPVRSTAARIWTTEVEIRAAKLHNSMTIGFNSTGQQSSHINSDICLF